MWNLTGGVENGIHCTDVTNASRTMLMNLETLKWDKRLCQFFDIPMEILPKIRSSAEIFGFIKIRGSNMLEGVPIASCMGNCNSALLGQLCLRAGQVQISFESDTSIMFNTGQEIIYSDHDLLTTVGFQLGANEKPFYALEGFVGNNCGAVEWLKSSILSEETNNNQSEDISPVSNLHLGIMNGNGISNCFKNLHDNEVIFVPALKGLCAPNFLFQAKGFLSGLSIQTKSNSIFTAAKESICFQTKTILESLKKDCRHWPALNKLVVGGEFSENVDFLQVLANFCCLTIERPQVSTSVGLGSLLSTALTMKCISLEDFKSPPIDTYYPTLNSDIIDEKYVKWLSTFKTSLYLSQQKHQHEQVNSLLEDKTAHQFIMNSLPGCLFLFTSYVLYVFSQLQLK